MSDTKGVGRSIRGKMSGTNQYIKLGSIAVGYSHSIHRVFMAALWNRAGHYIFVLWFLLSSIFFLSFFPRLFSAVADWMSIIFPHMV